MSLPVNAACYLCYLRRNIETARAAAGEEAATALSRDVMQLFLDAPEWASIPCFGPAVSQLLQKHCGIEADRFRQEKEQSNRFVLDRMAQLRSYVNQEPDPVYAGLQLAILGNYIDFAALQNEVSFEKLDEMLLQARDFHPSKECYQQLLSQLEKSETLLYLTDNAGEIGFDRIFAETLQARFPQLKITFCVRGGPAGNDATREDAAAVGVPFPVIDNGSCIAGTVPQLLSPEAKAALEAADVILSKGQANVESLLGCGKNVFYAFLVKCPRFMELFQKPKLTPMLVWERSATKE